MRPKYEVCYLDDDGAQKSAGVFTDFVAAKLHRDDLIGRGYEAWLEEVVPAHSEPTP